MGNIQQLGSNLHVLYNLCIIYIYNQVSFFYQIFSQNFFKESCCLMRDGTELHVPSSRYFAESLLLVTVFTEGTSRSFCCGSCLLFDVNIESKKLSGEGLFRDLYTSIISYHYILNHELFIE